MVRSVRRAFFVALLCGTVAEGLQKVTFNITDQPEKLPSIVVIATNQGQGSTLLSLAIGSNPCFIDLGEPFSPMERWYSETGQNALFAKDGQRGQVKTLQKVVDQLNHYFYRVGVRDRIQFNKTLHLQTKSMGEFFQAVQKQACDHLGRDNICQGRCILVHKLFPVYVSDDYSQLTDYLQSNETMVVQTRRNLNDTFDAEVQRFDMGPEGFIRLKQWDHFLDSVAHDVQGQKVWEIFNINNRLFERATNYFDEVAKLYEAFHFDVANETLMLEPVRKAIEKEFEIYDRKNVDEMQGVQTLNASF